MDIISLCSASLRYNTSTYYRDGRQCPTYQLEGNTCTDVLLCLHWSLHVMLPADTLDAPAVSYTII